MQLINYKEIKGYKTRRFLDDFKDKVDDLVFGFGFLFNQKPDAYKVDWGYLEKKVDESQAFIGNSTEKYNKNSYKD